ncbi:MAG: glycosyltransferase family 4 protein [Nitrospinota bacterium]|nr:glycosyltransferase family 4 protein [Nitrospinota bacterium]
MRILIISHAYSIPMWLEKIQELAKNPSLEISVLTPEVFWDSNRKSVTYPEKNESYSLYTGKVMFPSRVTGHFYIRGLKNAIRETNPDIIHLEEEPWSNVAAQLHLIKKIYILKFKLIVFSWENLDLNLRKIYKITENFTLRNADILIAGGITSKERLLRKGARPESIRVLPQFGLDTDLFKPAIQNEKNETFTIIYIGRIMHLKGVDIAIKAFKNLKGKWKAIFVGSGNMKNEIINLSKKLSLQDRIEFIEWVDHYEIPTYLRKAHVLILPSRTTIHWAEQFGHCLIEAMSAGIVPIGSDTGEIPHVIGNEGFVFPEEDHNSLQNAIQKLMDNPALLNKLAIAGREKALKQFSWEYIAAKTYEYYKELYPS